MDKPRTLLTPSGSIGVRCSPGSNSGRLPLRLWANAMPLITTQGLPPDERFEFWRDTIGRVAVQFRMEPVSKVPEGQIRLAEIGDLGLMNFDSAVVTRYARTRAEISRSQGPYYFVHLQLHGYCLLERGEERSTLAVGDCFVGDTLREFAMAFVTPDGLGKRSLVVRFPKEVLSGRVARPDLVHGAVLRSKDIGFMCKRLT